MKKRSLLVGALILIMVLTSGFSYAYWANTVSQGTQDAIGTVNIGTGEDITVSVSVSETTTSGQILVPTGFAVDSGETDEVTLSFQVTWNDDTALTGITNATVSALVENITVNGVANPAGLVTVTPDVNNPTEVALGSTVTFVFFVTLGTPSTVTEYEAVAGLPISFDITFTVNPN